MKSPFQPQPEAPPPRVPFVEGCRGLGLNLSAEQQWLLQRLVGEIVAANQTLNLVRFPDLHTLWMRHVLDSLTLTPLLGNASTLLDLGSGAGFPGLVIAIAASHLTQVVLVEATGKKAHFLRHACSSLALPRVEVQAERSETLARRTAFRERFDIVTARAVASLPTLLELAAPFACVNGRILAMKGNRAAQELHDSAPAQTVLHLSLNSIETPSIMSKYGSRIAVFVKQKPTDWRYPRAPGIPAKRPL